MNKIQTAYAILEAYILNNENEEKMNPNELERFHNRVEALHTIGDFITQADKLLKLFEIEQDS